VLFSQVVAELATANLSLLGNIVAQDPAMTPEWRALFENHGIPVVEHPAAFELVGANTLLVAPFMGAVFLAMAMKDHSGEVGMFLGNGDMLREQAIHVSTSALLVISTPRNRENMTLTSYSDRYRVWA
jgi:hypothetical protein